MDFLLHKSSFTLLILICFIVSKCYSQSQIPMSMFKKQGNIKNTRDFVNQMLQRPSGGSLQPMHPTSNGGNYRDRTETLPGFNEKDVEIMANQIASPDVCDPRPLSVTIPPDSDPRVMFWPPCTKLEQCGGCCGHELLECAPTSTEPVRVKVMKQRLSSEDGNRYDYMGNVDVTLQRHLACECRCKTKSADCNSSIHRYDDASCTCRCRNSELASSCQLPKRWEEKHCRCVCPTLINCLDDEYFDFNTCSCTRGATRLSAVPEPFHSTVDRCSGTRCRAGLVAQFVHGRCQCRRGR